MREPRCSARTSSPTRFVQQWFKVGGDGRDANQMNGTFNFTYLLANGCTIGTQPSLRSIGRRAKATECTFGRTTDRKAVQMRRPADVVPAAGSVLPGSSRRLRSEVEHSAASDADDPGPNQESALLNGGAAPNLTASRRSATAPNSMEGKGSISTHSLGESHVEQVVVTDFAPTAGKGDEMPRKIADWGATGLVGIVTLFAGFAI